MHKPQPVQASGRTAAGRHASSIASKLEDPRRADAHARSATGAEIRIHHVANKFLPRTRAQRSLAYEELPDAQLAKRRFRYNALDKRVQAPKQPRPRGNEKRALVAFEFQAGGMQQALDLARRKEAVRPFPVVGQQQFVDPQRQFGRGGRTTQHQSSARLEHARKLP